MIEFLLCAFKCGHVCDSDYRLCLIVVKSLQDALMFYFYKQISQLVKVILVENDDYFHQTNCVVNCRGFQST